MFSYCTWGKITKSRGKLGTNAPIEESAKKAKISEMKLNSLCACAGIRRLFCTIRNIPATYFCLNTKKEDCYKNVGNGKLIQMRLIQLRNKSQTKDLCRPKP